MNEIAELRKEIATLTEKIEGLEERVAPLEKTPRKLPKEWLELKKEIKEFCQEAAKGKKHRASYLQETFYSQLRFIFDILHVDKLTEEQLPRVRELFEQFKDTNKPSKQKVQ
ncbi:hypothetical protein [Listeria fleischmannii]|uniref:Uncharacterized protein n=1 Tax=Listeria fleischmannii FSL S10-1203 TaxID=1265822 RepID=W7DSF5_9LIST|nr:hypothetical protein [Listeria fleischmannii]EUJ53838.1 hypothetical protein MCOL2_10535 [Listeria fleischmannii FSL S10-1203]